MDKDVSITFEDDDGREWEISGRVTGGSPEIPVSWAGPGEPADRGELVNVVVLAYGELRCIDDVFTAQVVEDIHDKLWDAAASD